MKGQEGFIEWMVLVKLAAAVALVISSAVLGVDLWPTAPPPAEELVHQGMVMDIESGFNSKLITFADGTKVVVPADCDAWRGVNLRITSGPTGMHCGG